MSANDQICLHHNDAERAALGCLCPVCLTLQIVRLRAALKDLSRACTCDQPAVVRQHEGGGYSVTAPGPHTERCVHTRALKALGE